MPGVCTLPLTRAVVQYRDMHELDHSDGRVEDIGLALVIDGRYAAASEVVDLGSGRTKVLDLSTELVVLDWTYEPTHEHVRALLEDGAGSALRRYAFELGRQVLERVGFGPLTRPVVLRIGFRDLCRDFDLHEGTSIRLVVAPDRIVRTHLDCDVGDLVFRTAMSERDPAFERSLLDAFPGARLRSVDAPFGPAGVEYRARLPLPGSFAEARATIVAMRRGLTRLMARYEPDRFAAWSGMVRTFGSRETLSLLRLGESARESEVRHPASPSAAEHASSVGTVH